MPTKGLKDGVIKPYPKHQKGLQTVLFDKRIWTLPQMRSWIKKHNLYESHDIIDKQYLTNMPNILQNQGLEMITEYNMQLQSELNIFFTYKTMPQRDKMGRFTKSKQPIQQVKQVKKIDLPPIGKWKRDDLNKLTVEELRQLCQKVFNRSAFLTKQELISTMLRWQKQI